MRKVDATMKHLIAKKIASQTPSMENHGDKEEKKGEVQVI